MKQFVLAGLTATLFACAPQTSETSAADSAETPHAMPMSGVMISDARVRPPLPGRDIAVAYFDLTNHDASDQLLSVTTPISDKVELHNHLMEDGVMKMRRVTAVDLGENQTVNFKPGGLHVMIFGAQIPDGADDVSLTFNFVKADPVTVIADIEGQGETDETKPNTHSGH